MFVKHVAWIQFKPDVNAARIDEHKRAVKGLKEKISCIVEAEFGADFSGRADGLTHCIIITVRSKQEIEAYLAHPAHIPVAQALKADLARLQVMDVEFF